MLSRDKDKVRDVLETATENLLVEVEKAFKSSA
jgi:hypothetical protein